MTDASVSTLKGPSGPKPKRVFSSPNIIIYGTLLVVCLYYLLPLYVMIVTSLKGMPEIRMGNIFSPPVEVTYEPWVKAWAEACTGINCDGLSRGFWNSVWILVPSVFLSIAIASVNGYALANWKFKGSEVFFTILIFGAFIPYQVMIYPIVILLRESGDGITNTTAMEACDNGAGANPGETAESDMCDIDCSVVECGDMLLPVRREGSNIVNVDILFVDTVEHFV